MPNRKVFQILRHCSDKDLDHIDRCLRSPVFNTNRKIHRLFKYLRRYHPAYDDRKLEKTYILAKLFSEKEMTGSDPPPKTLRDLFYQLKTVVEKCLAMKDLLEDEHRFKLAALQAYERRGAYIIFEKEKKSLLKVLEKPPFESTYFYLLRFQIFQLWYLSPALNKYTPDANAIYYAQYNLEHFFVLHSLQNYCDQLLRKTVLKEKPPVKVQMDLQAILPWYRDIPLFNLYASTIELFLQEGEQFRVYRELVRSYTHSARTLSPTDQRNLLNQLIGYGNFQYNSGYLDYLQEVWVLYQYAKEGKLLLDDGVMSSITYTNIAATGSRLKQFDEVKSFLDTFTNSLKDEERVRAKALAEAYYWYYLGLSTGKGSQLDEAQKKLATVSFGSDDFALRIRSLSLRITFDGILNEEKDIDAFDRKIINFERWLRGRKKIADQKKEAYLTFNRILRNLAKAKLEPDPNEDMLEKLKKKIIGAENLVLKAWLLDKAGDLL